MVTIKPSPGDYDLVKYLFPFVIIVGICFIVLFISLVILLLLLKITFFQMIRLCRERRRLARKRLPRSYLKKIPTKKYKKGDPEETCAICLEDFQETEKLRILPCKHGNCLSFDFLEVACSNPQAIQIIEILNIFSLPLQVHRSMAYKEPKGLSGLQAPGRATLGGQLRYGRHGH